MPAGVTGGTGATGILISAAVGTIGNVTTKMMGQGILNVNKIDTSTINCGF